MISAFGEEGDIPAPLSRGYASTVAPGRAGAEPFGEWGVVWGLVAQGAGLLQGAVPACSSAQALLGLGIGECRDAEKFR